MKYMLVLKVLLLVIFMAGCESDSGSKKSATSTSSVDENTSDIAFSITSITDANLSMAYSSGDINITGIVGTVSVSVTSGTTLVKNGSTLSTLTTTLTEADTLSLTLTSSSSYSTSVSSTLTVGGVVGTFTVTTMAENLPTDFSFDPVTGAALNTAYDSNTVTIAGLDDGTTVSASFNQGVLTAAIWLNGTALSTSEDEDFTLTNGDTIVIRMTSSSSYGTTIASTLTVGSSSKSYSITTAAAPTVSISPSSLSLSYGDTSTLTATVTPSTIDNNITWMSSDSSIASVTSAGVVSAVGAGTATITAVAELAGYADINSSISVAVSVSAVLDIVSDFGGSEARYNSPVPNSSFVDLVLDSSDNYAFIANYVGMVVVDINESSSTYMNKVGAVDINTTEHVALSFNDDRLFIASGYDGLVSVNVATATSPAVLARYDSDYNDSAKYAWSVALAGNNTDINKAFVANCAGIDLFDVGTSTAITRLDELNITGGDCTGIATKTNKYDIKLSSTYAYVAYGVQGIQVIDWTTTPNTLDLNSSYSSTTCSDARGLDISSNRDTLFVACGSDGVDILDISDPQNIAKLANYPLTATGAKAEDVKLSSDGDLLLVSYNSGVVLLNVSTPSSPSTVASYAPGSSEAYAAVLDSNDSYYYLGDGSNGLYKLELTYQ